MSLKLRISLLTSILLTASVAGLTGTLIYTETQALLEGARQEQIKTVGALGEVCRDAAVNQHFFPLANYLKQMKTSPEILEASCLDARGDTLGHTDPTQAGLPHQDAARLLATDQSLLSEKGNTLEAIAPMRIHGRPLGVARVTWDRAQLKTRLQTELAKARRRILKASLPMLAAGFAGAFFITGWALRPFNRLVEGVRRIGTGEWGHRVSLSSRDEVGWLAGEVNHMAEKLGELDRMKADFVNNVTHDLKSPIAAVRAAVDVSQNEVETLLKGNVSPRLAEATLHIRERLERLTHLITSLLDVAKIESLTALERAPVDMEEVADAALRSFEMIARQKGLALDVVVENKIPEIRGDRNKLERALSNLVGNAVKFTEKGRVRITLAERGGRVHAAVADTGPGIPPESLEKLFSKFFRVQTGGAKSPQEGTGLGLAIAKGFVEAHGGTVSVESAVGRGTTFTMSLPR